jgi:hypothetical protein
MNEGAVIWDPPRLAAACDSIQDIYRRHDRDMPEHDPRTQYVASVLLAGRAVMDSVLESMPDAEHIVWLIDELPPEERNRAGRDYYDAEP